LSAIQVGEGFAGDGPDAAHINTVLGPRDGPVGTAWATALATPRAGHSSFVVVARPNMPVKPPTLFVNKAEIRGDAHGFLHWGAAQAAVARAVLEAVAERTIPQGEVDELVLIAAVWVDWTASDEEAVYENNVQATRAALASAAEGRPRLEDLIAIASEPSNPFFRRGS
jgi:5,6,7,8-tetrahydromethanopterin hydro-lyase